MYVGYIGITDQNWFSFNKSNNHKEVVFWRRASFPVNLPIGMPFFFLVKGTKPRYIRGYGIVKLIGSDKIDILWNKYGSKMGEASLSSVEDLIRKDKNEKIGYYILENVKYIEERFDLKNFRIEFPDSIVSGKKINEEDTNKLLSSFK
ncbi:MAG: hypothetical protein QXM96_03950 [Candidatus Woesearchaeota archaeon]